MIRTYLYSGVAAVSLLGTPLHAQEANAQQDNSGGSLTDEIIVTATRTELSTQKVGISVSAFSGEQMREVGIVDSTQIVQIIPGIQNAQSNSGATSSYSIRGVTQTDYGFSQEAPVALYVDDVYQANQVGAQFQLFDIGRVEVLRGPQGTLFGRNATGGLVHFVTTRPKFEDGGYIEGSYGSFNRVKVEGALNLALSETAALRVSAIGDFHDNIATNRAGPDLWNRNEYGGRIQLLLEPSDDLSVLFNLRGGKRDNTGTPYDHRVATPTGLGGGGVFAPPGATDVFGYVEPDNDPFNVAIDDVSASTAESWGASATVRWNLGSVTLHSITDYNEISVLLREDSDIRPGELLHFQGLGDQTQFSQELRLTGGGESLRWTLGGYYLRLRGDFDQRLLVSDLGYGVDEQVALYAVNTDSYSLFGQAEYDLSDVLTVTGGLRWIHDRKSQNYENYFTIDGIPGKIAFGASGAPNLLDFSGRDSQSIFAGRLQLDYKPTDNLLLYASYNRGVKGFGYNAPVDPSGSSLFINPLTYDPAANADDAFEFDDETLNAFEVGVKARFSRSARLNVSAFLYDYKNYQALNLAGITQIITNNDARMYGIDADLFLSPWGGLDVVMGASLLDTKVKGVNVGGVIVDREAPYAPKLHLTGMIRQEFDVAGGKAAVQFNGSYTDDQWLGLSNAPVTREDGYFIANARISYTLPSENVTFALFANNIGDVRYRTLAFDLAASFGFVENQFARPREFGGSVSFRF
jgi:iron complex outermembrane receptor protein